METPLERMPPDRAGVEARLGCSETAGGAVASAGGTVGSAFRFENICTP